MIDYNPRRQKALDAVAKKGLAAVTKSNERATFTQPVQKQRGTIYRVDAGGVTVDFTDRFSQAQASYKDASTKPKILMSRTVTGSYGVIAQEL
jgi:hypothetical protein